MSKREEYLEISKEITKLVGGMDNIQGTAHCATRLRIVLQDDSKADLKKLEDVSKVKGAFIAGNQLQLIFGAGLVNDVYEVFAEYTHTQNMSLGDLKEQSAKKQNPVQAVVKALSDVFIGIMPAILAAALLMGLTGVLGNLEIVKNNETLYALNKLTSLASTGIFAILPIAVCYSAVKRFGGNPVLGMVMGAIMLDSSLANAYSVGAGTVEPEVLHLFGLNVALVGFQGGIIIALMMGFVVAKLDLFFNKKVPDAIKLLLAPMLTVFLSTVLLFTCVGPMGRILSNGITGGLVWATEHLGVFGYALFGGLQQIIVITGLHHIIGAVEAQLIATTGLNFINPLMSVALMGQGGAVLAYLALNWKNVKARELCIPSFCSTLFGISEPAIFGVNLRYRYPLAGGCIGGAVGGIYVYFANLTSLGFGTTALPGIAIVNPENNGYVNYVIAHILALAGGFICAAFLGKIMGKKEEPAEELQPEIQPDAQQQFTGTIELMAPANGRVRPVAFIYPGGHALGLELEDGSAVLLHCGVDTVNLRGKGFTVLVKEGQRVAAGELLLRFDKQLIEKEGYSTELLMIISEVAEGRSLKIVDLDGMADHAVVAVLL